MIDYHSNSNAEFYLENEKSEQIKITIEVKNGKVNIDEEQANISESFVGEM